MYGAMFQDETDRVLMDRARSPIAEPAPTPGFFRGMGSAALDAVPAMFAESTRALVRLAEPVGRGLGVAQGVVRPDDVLRTEFAAEDAQLRDTVKRFTPDPATTGTAGQVVHGAVKVLGKAAGYATVGGLPGAVGGLAIDEGISETLRLTDKGVDVGTAAKVGAVHGVVTGASVLLPASGTTIARTAGLIALGGPAAFMGEQQAARMILDAADYTEIAKQYDPFDPVGLTVSTLLAGAAGAVGAAARRGKAVPDAPKVPPPDDAVAAAHVAAKAEHVDASALVKRTDVEGMNAHVDGLEAVARQLADGEAVRVPEAVRVDPEVATKAAEAARPKLEAVQEVVADVWDEPMVRAITPEDVQAEVVRMAGEAGWEERGGRIIRDASDPQYGAVVGRTEWVPRAEWFARMRQDMQAQGLANDADIRQAVEKWASGEKLLKKERATVEWMQREAETVLRDWEAARQQSPMVDGDPFDLAVAIRDADGEQSAQNMADVALVERAARLDEAAVERAAMEAGDDNAAFMARIKEIVNGETDVPRAVAEGRESPAVPQARDPLARAEEVTPAPALPDPARADAPKLSAPDPEADFATAVRTVDEAGDFMVPTGELDADGNPIRVSAREALEEADALMRQAEADAPAFEAAVLCFLGGAA